MVTPADINSNKPVKREEAPRLTPYRPVAPIPDDKKQKNKFKEYLEKTDDSKNKKPGLEKTAASKDVPDEEEVSSLFELARHTKEGSDVKYANKLNEEDNPVAFQAAQEAKELEAKSVQAKKLQPQVAGELKKSISEEEKTRQISKEVEMKKRTASEVLQTAHKKDDIVLANQQYATLAPAAIQSPIEVQKAQVATQATRAQELVKLIEQLQAGLQVVKTGQKTEVTINLGQPGIFQGATVVVTENATAKGQLDIAFYNLSSNDARNLISLKKNQDMLQARLLERGYAINQIKIEEKPIEPSKPEESQDTAQGDTSQSRNPEARRTRRDSGTVA